MKKTPVKGTNDYLPQEMQMRDRMQNIILSTYESCGFMHVETPAIEDIENLNKSDGGDNLNLIFKILKRGEKLEHCLEAKDFCNLSDLGLRYDLTLPLSRFYANNKEKLPLPFKCIQIGKVYRAERPQKGRLREFVQCDIDILGSTDRMCEVDLIVTTVKTLKNLGLNNFKIKLNDRQILKSVLEIFGFEEGCFDTVCVTLDKFDKIGSAGVVTELEQKGQPQNSIQKIVEFFENGATLQKIEQLDPNSIAISNLKFIINALKEITDVEVVFDISLVRGQGYYTSTVFEIESSDYSCALAGGGRYDNLIGKFAGGEIAAVGFSIGFERIMDLLSNQEQAKNKKLVAVFADEHNMVEAFKFAEVLQQDMNVSVLKTPAKLGKYLNRLKEQGFDGFVNLNQSTDVRPIE